ncbi:MAG TPA: hypothetical protein VF526_11450 [Solirubrobacteraceae bacterium]|jgi:hypothetical protein
MKRLKSTAASRAWLPVAFIGFAVIALVLALQLIPRLGAGQSLLDETSPAFTSARVDGTRAGVSFISTYVDFADPLMSTRGGASKEVAKLIALVKRRGRLTTARARRALKRTAPHMQALLRALPLSGASADVPRLTQFLAATLVTTPDVVQTTLVQRYPQLAQSLASLRNMTSGWYQVPGVDGRLTRFDGTPVTTTPQLRDYYRDDLVPLIVKDERKFQDLAGAGGIGYIPYLLIVVGLVVLAYGIFQARAATTAAPGRRAWGGVVALGALILAIVGAFAYFPRLDGANDLIEDSKPAFAQARVDGAVAGADFVHQTVLFGDPIATTRGGAAAQFRALLRSVAQQSPLTVSQVRRAVRRVAPRLAGLIEAIPMSKIADEVPRLMAYLSKRLSLRGDSLTAALKRSVPGLAQSIQAVEPVAAGWNAIPGAAKLTRLDGLTPASTMPRLDDYVRQDLLRVVSDQRNNFDRLAGSWPPVNVLPPLLAIVGALLALYGLAMMRLARKRS